MRQRMTWDVLDVESSPVDMVGWKVVARILTPDGVLLKEHKLKVRNLTELSPIPNPKQDHYKYELHAWHDGKHELLAYGEVVPTS